MDVSTLKQQIKTWERNFKTTHGREPDVKDIKQEPGLAQKYKDYKRLSKAADTARSSTASKPPSTPPRGQSSTHPSLLLSKPRSIAATQPLSGYNPFSPQKNKGKQKELSPDSHSTSNPFRIDRDHSPVPVAPSTTFPSTTRDPFAATPNNPISRARKRLRGEPVSPSPNKEKRRRIHDESDDEDDDQAANTSFVDDSPVKLPNGARSFKLLFDEAAAKPKFPLGRSKTIPPGLFGGGTSLAVSSERMDVDAPVSVEQRVTVPSKRDPFLETVEGAAASLSDDAMGDDRPLPKPDTTARGLLAPSPPPASRRPAGQPHLHNGKGRGKSSGEGQKKSDNLASEDEEGSDEDAQMNGEASRHKVRLFDRTASRGRVPAQDVEEDTYYLRTRQPPGTEVVEPQTSEIISLPDNLLSILSLTAPTSRDREDDHVVDHLLYGARRGNYDASKGGEIWGVGEFEEEERDEFALDSVRGGGRATRALYDDEDDWEGEGVPWEVGEL
ncbi:hypothetical protein C8F04DRAFT_254649 [Mycena alexandri]|uniref:DNA replication regulator SLD2 n=1 Tax=Mycena alexandri TaxID=1745969 RepID=A0AAD6TAK8_9AGAR|nr:hypothetical protein C8F04DRAFT_254649 [Mycena alexandri]